jgi:glycosyltransferase involved in cell wall biosynthesis
MMPAYNAGTFIFEAIKSMQEQTYKDWQLCIVDDGSTDLTYNYAFNQSLHDGRICLNRHLTNKGCPAARNTCLKMAEGDIIARLDADDTHDPVRLERQVEYLLEHDVDIVTCEMCWIERGVKMRKNTGGMDERRYLHGRARGPVCASIVTWRAVYQEVGGFDEAYPAGSDGDWNFRAILAKKRWGHIAEHWYNQRRHPGQLSKRMSMIQRSSHETSRKKHLEIWRRGGRR